MYKLYQYSTFANFADFYQCYMPPITKDHHTCVGLALELWTDMQHLNTRFPNISASFYLVSCEENIAALSRYTAYSDRLDLAAYMVEKEHVLLGLKFTIQDLREGVLLCDPGYHVSRVITAMRDKSYPHTGWFIQSDENSMRKEYNYQYCALDPKFIEWNERIVRNGRVDAYCTALVFADRPYLTAIDVTERRNLVYNFRSLLSRDTKGHLLAGIYFKLNEMSDEFTVFYQDMGKQRVKMKFSAFLRPNKVKKKLLNIVTICNEQLNLPDGRLLQILSEIGEVMCDKDYLQQLLDVNRCIALVSADN